MRRRPYLVVESSEEKRRQHDSKALLRFTSLPLLAANGLDLQIVLEPAPDFNEAIGENDLIFLRVVSPAINDEQCQEKCTGWESEGETCPIACGGTIPSIDLEDYDGIEVMYQSPESKEIFIVGELDEYFSRVRFEFSAQVDCDSTGYLDASGDQLSVDIQGSDTDLLVSVLDLSQSFISAGKCDGCGSCEIFTRLEFGGTEEFSGKISSIKVSTNPGVYIGADFSGLGPLDYYYDTEGYSWIRSNFVGSIIDAPSTTDEVITDMTTTSTVNPTTTGSSTSTAAPESTPGSTGTNDSTDNIPQDDEQPVIDTNEPSSAASGSFGGQLAHYIMFMLLSRVAVSI